MSASHPDRRTTSDRRETARRRVTLEPAQHPPLAGTLGMAAESRSAIPFTSSTDPIGKLAAAVEGLAARLAESAGRNTERATCTVEEAAALLGTTAKGIYALHERGKLPRSIGPGRRLVFLREELLKLARRASPSGGHGR